MLSHGKLFILSIFSLLFPGKFSLALLIIGARVRLLSTPRYATATFTYDITYSNLLIFPVLIVLCQLVDGMERLDSSMIVGTPTVEDSPVSDIRGYRGWQVPLSSPIEPSVTAIFSNTESFLVSQVAITGESLYSYCTQCTQCT